MESLFQETVYKNVIEDFIATSDWIETYLKNPLERLAIIVEEEGTSIGVAFFNKTPFPVLDAPHIYFASLSLFYIDPSYRNKGYMKDIVNACEYWGESIGAKGCITSVTKGNKKPKGYKKIETIYMKEFE